MANSSFDIKKSEQSHQKNNKNKTTSYHAQPESTYGIAANTEKRTRKKRMHRKQKIEQHENH
jgi:hypothetical protein